MLDGVNKMKKESRNGRFGKVVLNIVNKAGNKFKDQQ
jgi:hypothetical protein